MKQGDDRNREITCGRFSKIEKFRSPKKFEAKLQVALRCVALRCVALPCVPARGRLMRGGSSKSVL